MKNEPWLDTERNILKTYYNTISRDELMVKLSGRSWSSITSQVAYLRKRGWSFKERRKLDGSRNNTISRQI